MGARAPALGSSKWQQHVRRTGIADLADDCQNACERGEEAARQAREQRAQSFLKNIEYRDGGFMVVGLPDPCRASRLKGGHARILAGNYNYSASPTLETHHSHLRTLSAGFMQKT